MDPLGAHFLLNITFQSPSTGTIVSLVIIGCLLICSALMSASEVAFFSMSAKDLEFLRNQKTGSSQRILHILEKPKRLLATILIGNNMVNVAIVILSTTAIDGIMVFEKELVRFLVQVVGVTFMILLIGEVMPKIYANKNSKTVAAFMSSPILVLRKIFWPFSQLLISSSSVIDKRIKKKNAELTVDELEHAFEITYTDEETSKEEKKILEGIVKFGNTDVKQIMKPRTDVVAFDMNTGYFELIAKIIGSGFSRVPVFEGTLDKVKGILYIKDLLPCLNEKDDFKWQGMIREAFFVPENKKIDDLLKEFKDSKVHLAVVVDEYGGTSGIVTLEDIIEEIVGDITDEFDDEDITYTKIDDLNYVFEGKTSLVDIYKVLGIEGDEFEEKKGESDTLAGFLLERTGKLPQQHEKIKFKNYIFTIEAVDKRRIKQVKMTLPGNKPQDKTPGSGKAVTVTAVIFLFLLGACGNEMPMPKPKGYMRIELPDHAYVNFNGDCPYVFDYPTYCIVENKGMTPEEYCYKNLQFPSLRATVHLTYKRLDNNVDLYIEDCHAMAYEHSIKASSIDQRSVFNDTAHVYGLIYDIKGNAASPLQFYVTDSTMHFVRGALYFNARPNYDSVQPVLEFLKKDMDHFLLSLRWK
ncbi:MAG: gliding motility lipoprotein GldD [Bacteroidota bacterium]